MKYTPPAGLIPAEDTTILGVDGNAFAVMAVVRKGLLRVGNPLPVVEQVMNDMQSDDYDHLLKVALVVTGDA